MKHIPSVTFVMPAYNAARYIGESIESVRRQTETDWRLIVVDDGSTDDTAGIVRGLAESDARIKLLSMPSPSGSAYQPRMKAILCAETEFVSPLDADDWIDPVYLDRLLRKQRDTGADVVYPTMWSDETPSRLITPTDASLFGKIHRGRDCVKLTLDGWRMNCNGGLIRKRVYADTYARVDSSVSYSCADELLTRQLLWGDPAVAFSDAKYFYRRNPESITRKASGKLFDFLINDMELVRFTKENYSADSEEYMLAQRQNFHGIFDALDLLGRMRFDVEARRRARRLIRQSRGMADLRFLRPYVSPRYMAALRVGLPAARALLFLRRLISRSVTTH